MASLDYAGWGFVTVSRDGSPPLTRRAARHGWLTGVLVAAGIASVAGMTGFGLVVGVAIAGILAGTPPAGGPLAGLSAPLHPAMNPLNWLAIPGVSAYIPFRFALPVVSVLAVSAACHEWGHAVAARRRGYGLDSWGAVCLGPLPVGAFVNPDSDVADLPPADTAIVAAAGIGTTAVLAVLGYLALLAAGYREPGATFTWFWALGQSGVRPPAAAVPADPLQTWLAWFFILQVGLLSVNAMPLWRFDGGHLWSAAVEAGATRVSNPAASPSLDKFLVVGAVATTAAASNAVHVASSYGWSRSAAGWLVVALAFGLMLTLLIYLNGLTVYGLSQNGNGEDIPE